MRSLLQKHKKGVSEMVAYVLLIVIAISLSILAYAYLKIYVPKEKAECPADISIGLQQYLCESRFLNVTITNKGLHSIDSLYIRVGLENQTVKYQVNSGLERINITSRNGFLPGRTYTRWFSENAVISNKSTVLEIQPAVYVSGKVVACPSATITQPIVCSPLIAPPA